MISFKQFILTEDRIDFIKEKNPEIDTSHDILAKHKNASDVIDHFASKADPTKNKTNTQWIVNQYKKKNIRQEDAPQIKSTINDFEKVKSRLEKKDINQYDHIGELRDAISTQKAQATSAAKAKKTAASNKEAEMLKLYDSEGVTGYEIPNKEASIKNYGPAGIKAKTHWCTAANSSNNMFNHYKGGKYTMHFPNDEVLQFHHQSGQIMDKNDHAIHEADPRFAPYHEHISKFIAQTRPKDEISKIHSFVHYEPHEIDDAIGKFKENPNNYSDDNDKLKEISKRAKLSDKQFNDIHNLPLTSSWRGEHISEPTEALSENPNISHEQVGKLLSSPHREKFVGNLYYNPAVKKEHLTDLINSSEPTSMYRRRLANNPNLESHHIDELIKSPNVYEDLANNHTIKLSPSHQRTLIDGKMGELMAQRPDLTSESIDKLVKRGNERPNSVIHSRLLLNDHVHLSDHHLHDIYDAADNDTKGKMFNSDKITPELRERIFNDEIHNVKHESPRYNAVGSFVKSKYFTKDHMDKLLGAMGEAHSPVVKKDLLHRVADYSKASQPQIDKMIDYSNEEGEAPYSLIGNKNLKPKHIKAIFDMPKTNQHEKSRLLEHPAVDSDTLHHMYDKGNNWDKTSVLHHPQAQLSHFNKALDGGVKLHGALSSAPNTPPSILEKLASSPLSYVRHNVAGHKNTPKDALEQLAKDEDEDVSSLAAKKLKR